MSEYASSSYPFLFSVEPSSRSTRAKDNKGLLKRETANSCGFSSSKYEPLWTDPGLENGISACKLISTSNEKKKKPTKKQPAGIGSFSLP